jgi:hypothetical protein
MRSKVDASIRLGRGCRLFPFEEVGRADWARKGGSVTGQTKMKGGVCAPQGAAENYGFHAGVFASD